MAATAPSIPRAEPWPRPRPRPRRRPSAQRGMLGSVVWIVSLAAMLAGVVALNVAALQLNVRGDRLSRAGSDLRAENASLKAELSRAGSNPRLEALARTRLGLVPADPDHTTYVVLER